MKRYCHKKQMPDMKSLETKYKEEYKDLEIHEKTGDIIRKWELLTSAELYTSSAEWVEEKAKPKYISETETDYRMNFAIDNSTEILNVNPIICTETEGNLKVHIESVPQSEVLSGHKRRGKFIAANVRQVLESDEMLEDIITNIYYSFCLWMNDKSDDKYCELYTNKICEDDITSEDWKKYCRKGRDKEKNNIINKKKNKNTDNIAKEDFVTLTKIPLPVSCKIKKRSNQSPLIQNVIPNVFRLFIKNPWMADLYSSSGPERYKKLEEIEKGEYNISETYIIEEIFGIELSKDIAEFIRISFPDTSLHAVKENIQGELEVLISELLKWEGQKTRKIILDKTKKINMPDKPERERYHETTMKRWIQCVKYIETVGKQCYDLLYDGVLYILWMEADRDSEKLITICQKCLDWFAEQKREKNNDKFAENEFYPLVQKLVMMQIGN